MLSVVKIFSLNFSLSQFRKVNFVGYSNTTETCWNSKSCGHCLVSVRTEVSGAANYWVFLQKMIKFWFENYVKTSHLPSQQRNQIFVWYHNAFNPNEKWKLFKMREKFRIQDFISFSAYSWHFVVQNLPQNYRTTIVNIRLLSKPKSKLKQFSFHSISLQFVPEIFPRKIVSSDKDIISVNIRGYGNPSGVLLSGYTFKLFVTVLISGMVITPFLKSDILAVNLSSF